MDRAAPPLLVEAYGDSTTYGFTEYKGQPSRVRMPEPAILQEILRLKLRLPITVTNGAVSGTEASDLLRGSNGFEAPWKEQIEKSKADIITLNFSLNDAYFSEASREDTWHETPADYERILTEIISVARGHGKTVILYEPNPVCEPIRSKKIDEYIAVLNKVAIKNSVPVAKIYAKMRALPNWQTLLSDCLHPTQAGYRVKAAFEAEVVVNVVRSLSKGGNSVNSP